MWSVSSLPAGSGFHRSQSWPPASCFWKAVLFTVLGLPLFLSRSELTWLTWVTRVRRWLHDLLSEQDKIKEEGSSWPLFPACCLGLVQSHCPKKRPEKCSWLLTDIPSSPLGRWDCSNQEIEGYLPPDILAWSQTFQGIEKNHVLRWREKGEGRTDLAVNPLSSNRDTTSSTATEIVTLGTHVVLERWRWAKLGTGANSVKGVELVSSPKSMC